MSIILKFAVFCIIYRSITVESIIVDKRCPSGWVSLARSNYCYYYNKVPATWANARSRCQNLQGDLVVPKSSKENRAIWKIAKQHRFGHTWIGLERHQDTKFYTIYGSKPSYTNWGPGEPNSIKEKCTHFTNQIGQWNDISCSNRRYNFICESKKIPVIDKLYCGENKMTLSVEKHLFNVSSGRDLQLIDSSCEPQETKTHYVFITSLSECGTRMVTDKLGRSVSFTNKVMERKSAFGNNSITRSKEIEFPFACFYPRSHVVSSSQFSLTNVITTLDNFTDAGNISLVMRFHNDTSFEEPNIKSPNCSLNKQIYVEIRMKNSNTTTNSSIGIKLNECFASAPSTSQREYKYTLIQRGCAEDKTVKFYQSPGTTARFSFLIFRFRGFRAYSIIIHCRVTFCDKNNGSCEQSCQLPSNHARQLDN